MNSTSRGRHQAVLQLMNGPRLVVAGRPAPLAAGSMRFVVFLALHRRPVSRRWAAATLWPDCDEARAAGNLRSAMWRLRTAGTEVIASGPEYLAMQAGVAVDVVELDGWAGRVLAEVVDPADLRVPPETAAALDLLPGWYDDWVAPERERLRHRTLHALEAVSRHLSRCGRHGEAVDAAIQSVCAEPLRESAHRTLMSAHLAEGNWVEVRRCYQICVDLLSRELRVRPSADLDGLLAATSGALPAGS